jgi:hypothetical protein
MELHGQTPNSINSGSYLIHDPYAFQSGGNLSFLSDGIISGDAHFKSGGNLSFRTLTGGTGKFVSLFDPVIYSDGDVDLGSYTGASLKVEAGGNIFAQDITITGPDDSGSIPADDPDYEILTGTSALILRGGLSEPASIISVGNIRAEGGYVELKTNGNIFTGNINVSSRHIDKPGSEFHQIKLKAHNIFTGTLRTGVSSVWTCFLSDTFVDGCAGPRPQENKDPAGSISLEATQYLRTGDIDTQSEYVEYFTEDPIYPASGDGGNLSIRASDAIVGNINTSSTGGKGGDVSVQTVEPFQSGTITTDGTPNGSITIAQLPTQPLTDPIDPGNSADPTNPSNPVDSGNPTDPTDPIDPGNSTGPIAPSDPSSGQNDNTSPSSGTSNGSSGGSMGGSSGMTGDPVVSDSTSSGNTGNPDSTDTDGGNSSDLSDGSVQGDELLPTMNSSDPSDDSSSGVGIGTSTDGYGHNTIGVVGDDINSDTQNVSNPTPPSGNLLSATSLAMIEYPSNNSNNEFFETYVLNDLSEDDIEFYIQGKQHFQEIRLRLFQFVEAQKLAGQRMTAQQIADKLDIPLHIAQVAVLNPVGEDIRVDIPDLADLTLDSDGILIARGAGQAIANTIKRLIPILKKGGKTVKKWIFGAPKLPLFVKDIIKNPKAYWGKSAEEISEAFQKAGYQASVRQAPHGSQRAKLIDIKGHPQIQQIEVHPGGGLHKGAYYRFSTNSNGKIKIVDPKTYKPAKDPERNVTFLHIR